jgi:hypothetical protein
MSGGGGGVGGGVSVLRSPKAQQLEIGRLTDELNVPLIIIS